MCPSKIDDEIASLIKRGVSVGLVEQGTQHFARVIGLATPAPPWGAATHDILIAIPIAYESAGLDAFYVSLPCLFNGGAHPRINGAKIEIGGVTWQLVSWHYPDEKRWIAGQDDLGNHIEHCRGFFLNRKAINAY